MMPLRTPRWAGMIRNLEEARMRGGSNVYRNFSSTSARGRVRSNFHEPPSIHLPTWRTVPLVLKPLGCIQSKRFASTNHVPAANVESSPVSGAQPVVAPTDQFISSPLDSITAAEYPRIAEHVGYLKDLGLDYGWGPTALLQTILEYVHIYSGTGWGVSMLLTTLFVRLVLLKAFINASDTAARVAVIAPTIAPIKARIKEARTLKDTHQIRVIAAELREIYKSAGIQQWRTFVPMLQLPLGFGTFRLLRGMADLPVPGLDNAGFLWLTDLTMSDPYYILPVFTGIATHLTFAQGGEVASNPLMSEAWKTTMLYGAPLITSFFMAFWPGALQMTFAFTSLMSFAQSYCLRQPWVRTLINIQPLPVPPKARSNTTSTKSAYTGTMNRYKPPPPPPSPVKRKRPVKKGFLSGVISNVKDGASQVLKTARNMRDGISKESEAKVGSGRRTVGQLQRAQEYELMRRKEIAQEKLDREKRRLKEN